MLAAIIREERAHRYLITQCALCARCSAVLSGYGSLLVTYRGVVAARTTVRGCCCVLVGRPERSNA